MEKNEEKDWGFQRKPTAETLTNFKRRKPEMLRRCSSIHQLIRSCVFINTSMNAQTQKSVKAAVKVAV
jgi:hypothetical protein